MNICSNCNYFKDSVDGLLLTGQRSVVCRRYPPVGFFVMSNHGGQSMGQIIYRQAETKPDGWCGEWTGADNGENNQDKK